MAVGCFTLCESYDIKLREIRQNLRIREGISEKFGASIVLLSANFRAVRTVVVNIRLAGTKIRLRTKGEYRSSTFDELLMKGRLKETSQRLNNNENNL